METLVSMQIAVLLAEFHPYQIRLITPENIVLAVLFLVGIVLLMTEFKLHLD